MAKTIAQTGTGKYESSSALTCVLDAFASSNTAGNSIYVMVTGYKDGATGFGVASIADTKGNTYAAESVSPYDANNTGRSRCEIWAAHNIGAQASNVVTITLNATSAHFIHAQPIEVAAGAVQSTDQYGSGNTTTNTSPVTATCGGANADAGAISIFAAGEFMFGGGTTTLGLPTGYTSTYLYTNCAGYRPAARFGYKILSGVETTSISVSTDDTNGYLTAAVATFKVTTGKFLKLLAHSGAASAADVEGVVLNAARDTVIGEFTGQAFEASLEGSPGEAVLLIAVADITPDGSTLTTSDTPIVFAYNSTDGTVGEGSATVIEA